MKAVVKIQLVVIFFVSCTSSKYTSKEMEGVYERKGNPNIKLILSKDKFSFTDPYKNDLALYTCCDTITTGFWTKEKDLVCLSTPQIKSSVLPIEVKEVSNFEKDTLYFYLNNPIEVYYKKYEVKERDIFYRVSITDNNGRLQSTWIQEFNSNFIKIVMPKNLVINNFSIGIYPKAKFGGRNIGTQEVSTFVYHVKKQESNFFEINIPGLSYEFMTYIRLNRDFVRIVNKNKLEWDGYFYMKE